MGTVSIKKLAKKKLDFKTWCKENRWSKPQLSREFSKYGVKVAASTMWYWDRGLHSPRDNRPEVLDVLSEICGFDANELF